MVDRRLVNHPSYRLRKIGRAWDKNRVKMTHPNFPSVFGEMNFTTIANLRIFIQKIKFEIMDK